MKDEKNKPTADSRGETNPNGEDLLGENAGGNFSEEAIQKDKKATENKKDKRADIEGPGQSDLPRQTQNPTAGDHGSTANDITSTPDAVDREEK